MEEGPDEKCLILRREKLAFTPYENRLILELAF